MFRTYRTELFKVTIWVLEFWQLATFFHYAAHLANKEEKLV